MDSSLVIKTEDSRPALLDDDHKDGMAHSEPIKFKLSQNLVGRFWLKTPFPYRLAR